MASNIIATRDMKRPLLIYGLLWVLCGFGIAAILHIGNHLPQIPPATGSGAATVAERPWLILQENLGSSLGRLLLQLIVIVAGARIVGFLFRRVGLPVVVGEITAGILLGPSLLGRLWPGGFNFIFAAQSLDILHLCSQIGVTVFMFVVGMELEVGILRENARTAILTSQFGILVPYLFGMASAIFLYSRYAGAGTSFATFALFLGVAMSVTAFPVLVRILEERGMVKTPLVSISIACAAVGDVGAWIILALVVAFARGKGMDATLFNLGPLAIFVALMLGVVRRWLPRWLGTGKLAAKVPTRRTFVAALLFMTGSALATRMSHDSSSSLRFSF